MTDFLDTLTVAIIQAIGFVVGMCIILVILWWVTYGGNFDE